MLTTTIKLQRGERGGEKASYDSDKPERPNYFNVFFEDFFPSCHVPVPVVKLNAFKTNLMGIVNKRDPTL